MISLRVTRDRRGYEHIYLVSETRRKGRPVGRLLYWSRSPGGLRVGREPFDAETRAAIQRANPDIVFDWAALLKAFNTSAAAARWAARQQREAAASGRGGRAGMGSPDEPDAAEDLVEPAEPAAAAGSTAGPVEEPETVELDRSAPGGP